MDLSRIHHALVENHREALADPRNSAEGLDFASCPPHRQHLATLAAAASAEGISADAWRSAILEGLGPEAGPLLESAESCMRESGLWPWPS
jgi:hypothetical protein